MIRFLFRFFATIALAIAVIMAVLDATRSVATKTLAMTPLLRSWQGSWPDGAAAAQAFFEQKIHPWVWDPIVVTLLSLPGSLLFTALALLLYALGRRPVRRVGRFVVED